MLFTVRILGASSYETRRANDTASILVPQTIIRDTGIKPRDSGIT